MSSSPLNALADCPLFSCPGVCGGGAGRVFSPGARAVHPRPP